MEQDSPRHEFHVMVGSPSHDLPACREVTYSLSLIGEQGKAIEREHSALVYEGLLSDSDQVHGWWRILSEPFFKDENTQVPATENNDEGIDLTLIAQIDPHIPSEVLV